MRPTSLVQLACWADGRLMRDDGAVQIHAVHTDTRSLQGEGILFIALKGDNFDGHDHLAEAAKRGARAALVSREIDIDLPQIVVENTVHALATLAAKLQSIRNTKVIAITGSNGKTTVKRLTAAILQKVGNTYYNPGNRNNEIGLPLAVIDAPEDAEFAIYEMGAGQPGDIGYLTAIAKPGIALINNIAPAHLERMKTLLGIAETKAAIYDALPEDGIAIINADDAFAEFFAARVPGRQILRFGLESSADIWGTRIQPTPEGSQFMLMTPEGRAEIHLPLPGRHNVSNALAAASLALAAGAPLSAIAAGLSAAQAVSGRMCAHYLANGVVLIDDSYNANPGSLKAAIETLAKNAWLILGDMRELGPDAETLHADAGEQARKAGIAKLFTLGQFSLAAANAFGAGAQHFDTHEALITALTSELAHATAPPTILVKGSRGSRMERVVHALLNEGARDAA